MRNDKITNIIDLIGKLLSDDQEYPLERTLLHAELDQNYVSPAIFKDRGDYIIYREPDLDRLGDALLDLWEACKDSDRWAEFEYFVQDGKFNATFVYPDEIDPNEEPLDRRDRVVAEYFGEKPIIYPDPDGKDHVFEI